jgi:hypothetical protein
MTLNTQAYLIEKIIYHNVGTTEGPHMLHMRVIEKDIQPRLQ